MVPALSELLSTDRVVCVIVTLSHFQRDYRVIVITLYDRKHFATFFRLAFRLRPITKEGSNVGP